MKKRIAALLAVAVPALAGSVLASPAPANGRHPSWTVESCLSCHRGDDLADLSGRVVRPCRTLCESCHDFRESHHRLGVPIGRGVRAPLLLTESGTSTCSTCHDTSRPRFESSPWVSQSLFERIARRSAENRTYYLAMRNDKGQLCRNCH